MADKPLLLRHKGFFALTITQFLGAFNDNAFITLITLFTTQHMVHQEEISRLVTLASALFAAPFLLFSTHAGFISDRVSKQKVAVFCKILEVIIACLAFFALKMNHVPFLLGIIFLMGLHSTFFGPAKYGILPEILDERDISNGNGIIQLSTFVAIILGIVAGGLLLQHVRPNVHYASAAFLIVAAGGLVSSLFITHAPPATSGGRMEWNPAKQFYSNVKMAARDRVLFLCLLGTAYFWFVGSLFKQDLLVYGKTLMHATDTSISVLLALLALGIGIGSGAAGKISGDKVELGLVPIGAMGIGIFSFDLMFAASSMARVSADLFFVGFCAGFFIVPLGAMIQIRSDKDSKGMIIATSNIISFLGILAASGFMWMLSNKFHLDPAKILGFVAVATVAGTIYVLWLIPVAFARLVFWFMTHTVYRIKVVGRANFPLHGPALLVCNHVAYIDPFLISAALPRSVRFFMWRKIYDWKPLNWFFRLMKMIPISPSDGPRRFAASMEEARQALKEGHVVCIFAEGAITRLAQTLGFKKGMEYIVKDLDVPIIPVHLDRVWGSIFSFHQGEFIWKIPRRLPYPVTVSFGKPLPSTAKAGDVRQAVMDLSTEAFSHRMEELLPLHQTFLRQAKSLWFSRAMADSTGLDLTFGKAATAAVILARKFRKLEGDQVGVLLPPSAPAALVNIALLMAGKIPVNLNFTLSKDIIDQTIAAAEIKKIITAGKMLEAVKWEKTEAMVCLEDLPRANAVARTFIWGLCFVLPSRLIEAIFLPEAQTTLDQTAALLFTSGSTGIPKGVMLSHANIQANVQGLIEVFRLDSEDTLIGALPFFHSFGFTGTFWFPLLGGIPVVYHRSPLESAAIQKVIRDNKATILVGTPTFLQMWMKKFKKEDIGSLRFILTGAEKLRDNLAQEFFEKFSVTVLEGYGCTELSPAACVSVLNVQDRHEFQLGHKSGSVGRPLPGVSVRIVDFVTQKPVPQGQPGLLVVKGPNVMKGYWKDPAKTAEVVVDGAYVTGDVAAVDEDGFVKITDRLSRFSKIGGEMVPHILIEEKIYAAAGPGDAQFLVVSVPDASKGEALAVLTYQYGGSVDELIEKLKQSGLPPLWLPDKRYFFALSEWPASGTGKVDMLKAKEEARRRAAEL